MTEAGLADRTASRGRASTTRQTNRGHASRFPLATSSSNCRQGVLRWRGEVRSTRRTDGGGVATITRECGWCSVTMDDVVGRVTLVQRWHYVWAVSAPATAWTRAEQLEFHTRAATNIRAAWSHRVRLQVSGKSAFAKRFGSRGVLIDIDIRWVKAQQHWTVTATKLPVGRFLRSSVDWTLRRINLDSNDFVARQLCNTAVPSVCTAQIPVAHEFGHALGNVASLGSGDEYPSTSKHFSDNASILHSGSILRGRHLDRVVDELNKMMPDTAFSYDMIAR